MTIQQIKQDIKLLTKASKHFGKKMILAKTEKSRKYYIGQVRKTLAMLDSLQIKLARYEQPLTLTMEQSN